MLLQGFDSLLKIKEYGVQYDTELLPLDKINTFYEHMIKIFQGQTQERSNNTETINPRFVIKHL